MKALVSGEGSDAIDPPPADEAFTTLVNQRETGAIKVAFDFRG